MAVTALAGLWSLMLIPFAGMHAFQILTNQTTIEYMKRQSAKHRRKVRQRDARRRLDGNLEGMAEEQTEYIRRDEDDIRNPWYYGMMANWKSIMGDNPWLWFGKCCNLSIEINGH